MLLLTLLAGWVLVSIPVTLGMAHAAHLAAEREAERRSAVPPRNVRVGVV
jgi:hypothetical protein